MATFCTKTVTLSFKSWGSLPLAFVIIDKKECEIESLKKATCKTQSPVVKRHLWGHCNKFIKK